MNRTELQQLAEMRLSDAKVLLQTGQNDAGAFYLAGYAVECGVKACIARNQGQYPFPPRLTDKQLRDEYYTHSIETLFITAGLKVAMDQEAGTNPDLRTNWTFVTAWSEQTRYETSVSHREAEDLINAVEDGQNGILQWLKNHW